MAGQLSVRDTLTQFIERCQRTSGTDAQNDSLDIKLGNRPLSLVVHYPTDISLDEPRGFITCICPVAQLRTAFEQAYFLMLQANDLWAGTRGATLGLVGDDVVILSISRPLHGMTSQALHGLLKKLSVDARAWSGRLQLLDQPESSAGLTHTFA